MNVFNMDSFEFQGFMDDVESIISSISVKAKDDDILGLQKLASNFKIKIEDFYRENRKLNIGVV